MFCTSELIMFAVAKHTAKKLTRPSLAAVTTIKYCQTASTSVVESGTGTKSSQPTAPKKRTQKFPFVKSLFVGKFDCDVLTYPEVLDKERLHTLEEMVPPIEKFFSQDNLKTIAESGYISKEMLNRLKSLGLFGQQIPQEYGGLGLNATECARLGEIIASGGALAVTLSAHQSIGLKGLLLAGSEEQKRRYLPRVATGEWISAFCLSESESGSDAISVQTTAKLSEDNKEWILNGRKMWVTNGGIADFFTVFAKTENLDYKGDKLVALTAFLVERDFGGVYTVQPESNLGIRASNTCEVVFSNTPVPVENVLGNIGEGFQIAMDILDSGRFSLGNSSAGILKELIEQVTRHAINKQSLSESELIRQKIAKTTALTYAMESMTYLTAGMLDSYENPDCAVEAAIVKVFSSESCWHAVSECLQILGGVGYMKDLPFERYLKDSRIMMIFEGGNDMLRSFIALAGLQYAGVELQHIVRKVRNPLMNPAFIIARAWQNRKHAVDNPKLSYELEGYLHPNLRTAAHMLEYCVLRLQYGVEVALSRHGKDIMDRHMEVKRMADVAIDIYTMTAVLGRASRSYCIGLQHAEEEVLMAFVICCEAHARVKLNILELERFAMRTMDDSYMKLASQVFKSRGYFPQHPLSRNF